MDGQTLVNLEIFGNNADGGPSGKFLQLIFKCSCLFQRPIASRLQHFDFLSHVTSSFSYLSFRYTVQLSQ